MQKNMDSNENVGNIIAECISAKQKWKPEYFLKKALCAVGHNELAPLSHDCSHFGKECCAFEEDVAPASVPTPLHGIHTRCDVLSSAENGGENIYFLHKEDDCDALLLQELTLVLAKHVSENDECNTETIDAIVNQLSLRTVETLFELFVHLTLQPVSVSNLPCWMLAILARVDGANTFFFSAAEGCYTSLLLAPQCTRKYDCTRRKWFTESQH